jgi:glycosyltransferase involved in cell wall biosynthesis
VASFGADLAFTLASSPTPPAIRVIAVDEHPGVRRPYPSEVFGTIAASDPSSYRYAAQLVNDLGPDLVLLQHEFQIFGGDGCDHLTRFLSELRRPLISVLHTVLAAPEEGHRRTIAALEQRSRRLITLTEAGRRVLHEVYRVPRDKISLIPHGVPDLPMAADGAHDKKWLGLEGRSVVLTFGLLSPGKGIETTIAALPRIMERHRDVVFLVVGATHPAVKAVEGEAYRASLERLAEQLGVAEQVRFEDRFVSNDELERYLSAADVFVTPYAQEQQVSSGVLAYAMAAGKPIVSTAYPCAKELLADGRGSLVPVNEASAMAEAIRRLLDNPAASSAMGRRAYRFARGRTWTRIGPRYLAVAELALDA